MFCIFSRAIKMASNLLLSIEIALDDTWYIKKTDDDGVFVKVNGYRAKNTSIKSFELPVGARCIVGYLRQKSGHQLSKNSHIEILTSDLRLVLLLFFDFPFIRCPQKV